MRGSRPRICLAVSCPLRVAQLHYPGARVQLGIAGIIYQTPLKGKGIWRRDGSPQPLAPDFSVCFRWPANSRFSLIRTTRAGTHGRAEIRGCGRRRERPSGRGVDGIPSLAAGAPTLTVDDEDGKEQPQSSLLPRNGGLPGPTSLLTECVAEAGVGCGWRFCRLPTLFKDAPPGGWLSN